MELSFFYFRAGITKIFMYFGEFRPGYGNTKFPSCNLLGEVFRRRFPQIPRVTDFNSGPKSGIKQSRRYFDFSLDLFLFPMKLHSRKKKDDLNEPVVTAKLVKFAPRLEPLSFKFLMSYSRTVQSQSTGPWTCSFPDSRRSCRHFTQQ